MNAKLLDDCFLHDKDRLLHAEALAILKERLRPVVGTEMVALADAAGRIAAAPVIAPRPIPAHNNAAVDGYAFAFADYDAVSGSRLKIGGRAAAGHALRDALKPHEAARIFTGATMPEGADTVIMQEDVTLTEAGADRLVDLPPGMKSGANRRLAGEDVMAGQALLAAGDRLRPQDVAAIAAAGFGAVECFARLKVAIISSGDEVIRPGDPFEPGKVYDSNAPMLVTLARLAGADCVDLGVMPDNAEAVARQLRDAASRFDVLITTGGASRGEEDHVVKTLDALGKLRMWQLAIKPGRPMAFGQIGDCVVLGLPGNPVAVFVCFLLYAQPLIGALGGSAWREPGRLSLPAAFSLGKRKTGRREFWRGRLVDGAVTKFERDGSGLITSLRDSDGLIEIAEDVPAVSEGDLVSFIPYTEFGIRH
ncbi:MULTISPECIES: gephyrin-like molybdotransferase Glp [Rhodomicrobium]|uniref:molybdopterin molybdotransferase MoeA n=1 Tax=Rhodomicrobium TaxID=1068 RepID=UPI000B4B5567|nr:MULTISPECIES: gephyrin-like molybdotransferase Glp [Rhodomicrobium]